MEFKISDAVNILERTPATLNSMLLDLPGEWTSSNEGEGSWSPFDIVGHLIHGEEADWIPRARTILDRGEEATFEPFDREAMFTASKGRTMPELLATFVELRRRSLESLEQMKLTDELLSRRGTHPEFGTVTLGQLISTWVVHDHAHIAQIARVLAKQYREAVGPWRAYLSILDR
ncbi:MAG: DinB family protein [Pyrinomonadaceae bacterium]